MSAVKYCLLLVGLILCNACGVWVYLPEDVGSWAKPEGSEYFEVNLLGLPSRCMSAACYTLHAKVCKHSRLAMMLQWFCMMHSAMRRCIVIDVMNM